MAVPTNYFEKQNRFKLVDVNGLILPTANDFILIPEPEGFDAIRINVKRDPKTHGVMWEFSDEEVDLRFDLVRLSGIQHVLFDDSDFSTSNWTHTLVTTFAANNDGVADRFLMGSGGQFERSFSGLTEGDWFTARVKIEDIATTIPPAVATINLELLTSSNVQIGNTQMKPVEEISEYAEFKVSGQVPANGIVKIRISNNAGNTLDFHIKELFAQVDYYSPRQFLQDFYNSAGTTAKVELIAETYNGSTWDIDYQGRINFNKYQRSDSKLTIPVKRMDFDDKFRTRSDSKMTPYRQTDFDSNSQAGLQSSVINMVINSVEISKSLSVQDSAASPVIDGDNYGAIDSATFGSINRSAFTIGMTEVVNNQFRNFITQGTIWNNTDHDYTDAESIPFFVNKQSIFQAPEKGTYTIAASVDVDVFIDTNIGDSGTWNVNVWVVLEKLTGNQVLLIATGTGSDANSFTKNITGSLASADYELNAGDRLYFYGAARSEKLTTTDMTVTVNDAALTIDGLTRVNDETVQCYRLFDLLRHSALIMTGNNNIVESSFLGAGGAAYEMLVTGGNQLRQNNFNSGDADTFSNQIQYSFNDIFNSVQALFGLGMQVYSDSGTLKILIERFSYFYRSGAGNIIMTIESTEEFEMYLEESQVFNEIKVGYDKYLDGDEEGRENSSEDFNQEQTYLTPIETVKNAYEAKSTLIASPFTIEATRRASRGDESWKFDDELFVISSKYGNSLNAKYPAARTDAATGNDYFTFNEYLPEFSSASSFKMAGLSTVYVISSVAITADKTVVYVTNTVTNAGYLAGVLVEFFSNAGGSTAYDFWRPENDEPFDSVTGLTSPGTILNLRLHPKTIFLNHAPIFNAGLFYTEGEEDYINTYTKGNGNLQLQFSTGENDTTLDPNRVNFKMKDDISLGNTDYENTLFRPEKVRFKCQLTYAELQDIRSAMMNENATADKNRGYVLVKDDEGVYWIVFIDDLVYNPLNEQAEISGKILTAGFTLENYVVRTMEANDYRLTEDGGYRLI